MTQYNERVEQQRRLLKAEELADNITNIHVHSLNSMWYDDRPQDTENHSVTDIDYPVSYTHLTLPTICRV